MKYKEWYNLVDKSEWERGEWDGEPDKVQWVDKDTGLFCLAVRAHSHWCGYVGVGEGHKFYGVEYDWCSLPTAKPHGVLTDEELEPIVLGDKECPECHGTGHKTFMRKYVKVILKHCKNCKDSGRIDNVLPNLAAKIPWLKERIEKRVECEEGSYCSHSPESMLNVHGGITFTGVCQETPDEATICLLVEEGEEEKVFWFGFDCAHVGDQWSMASDAKMRKRYADWDTRYPKMRGGETYKNLAYVQEECRSLAKQLKAVGESA